MKAIILLNNIKNETIIKKGIDLTISLLKSYGIDLVVSYKTTNLYLPVITLNTDVVQGGYGVNYQPILNSVSGSEDIALLIYNADNIVPKPTNPCSFHVKKGNCIPIEIPEFFYGGDYFVLAEFFIHELAHTESFRYGKQDLAHFKYYPMWNNMWGQKSNVEYYLYLLKDLIKTQPKYKYFSEKEIKGLKPELVQLLDKMRGECGFPFVINSGFRTIAENNKLKDAVEDSAHTLGLAVDLKCLTSDKRFKIIESAFKNGITRVGVGDTFVHLDIDGSKPQKVIWLYK